MRALRGDIDTELCVPSTREQRHSSGCLTAQANKEQEQKEREETRAKADAEAKVGTRVQRQCTPAVSAIKTPRDAVRCPMW